MNEFVRAFSAKVNEIFMSGYDYYGNPGEMFFTARKPVAGDIVNDSQYTIADFQDANGYYEMTAFNIQINDALLDNADLYLTDSILSWLKEQGKMLIICMKDTSYIQYDLNIVLF
mgnify:CR=1 FL=1